MQIKPQLLFADLPLHLQGLILSRIQFDVIEERADFVVELPPPYPKQQQYIDSEADITIFGGSAGGSKSYAALLDNLETVDDPKSRTVIFRRELTEIKQEGGLWDEAHDLFPLKGGTPLQGRLTYKFPSGATVRFAHLIDEATAMKYKGGQFNRLTFDQLETFSDTQFFYLISRLRTRGRSPVKVKGNCNPDPDSWLRKFLAWWIDDETGYARLDRANLIRWFVRVDNELHWADTKEALARKFPKLAAVDERFAKSVTFIPSSLDDNPVMLERNPAYKSNLLALPEHEKERLLYGNWNIKAGAGKVFHQSWFKRFVTIEEVPKGGRWKRFYDLASTEKEVTPTGKQANDPDATASCMMKILAGTIYIADVTEDFLSPADTDELIKRNAVVDSRDVEILFEQEGGASGKRDIAYLTRMLQGYIVQGVVTRKDKIKSATPFAVQAKAGNVVFVRRPGNNEWIDRAIHQLHHFPDLSHDDIPDAIGKCYLACVEAGGWAMD